MAKDIDPSRTYHYSNGTTPIEGTLVGQIYVTVKGALNYLARNGMFADVGNLKAEVIELGEGGYAVMLTQVPEVHAHDMVEDVASWGQGGATRGNRRCLGCDYVERAEVQQPTVIHFDVKNEDGTRELRIEGTDVLVGWIEDGRRMVDFNGRRWTEWVFIPAVQDADEPRYAIHDSINKAYGDARRHAATLVRA